MKVAVWDTYVKKQNGNVLHFDIVVPEDQRQEEIIHSYGKKYLAAVGEPTAPLSLKECQFCHIEEPTEEIKASISRDGYYILPMEEIPAQLSDKPTRREMILFLRAHFDEHRFANFKGVGEEEVRSLLRAATRGQKDPI